MATSLTNPELFATNEFKRMLPGYIALIPLLAQTFLMNPCYEKSRSVRIIRAALMPITIYLTLSRVALRLFYPLDVFFHWNFAFVSFPTFHAICLAIQYGLSRGPIFLSKEGMIKAGNYRGDPDDKDEMQKPDYQPNPRPSLLERIKFTIWILFSPRGLETSWAPSLSVVPRGPKMSAGSFFLFILGKTVVCHFMMTLLWFIAVSCAQHPQGSWGFLDDYIGLGPFKWVKNYPQLDHLKAAPFGGAAWFAIDTLGCLFNLLEIILFQVGPYILPKDLAPGKFDTTLYPALFNDLSSRESVIAFWSKGWHAIFRRNIIFCGWNPLEYIFSVFGKDAAKMGGMMGGMIFSGIFHEYLIAAVSRIDCKFPTVMMFTVCGLGMVAEVTLKRRTGIITKGVPGRIWLVMVLGCYGTAMVESWIARGLGRADIPPPRLWTWPRYLVPFSGLLPERWISRLESLAH
ncbi:hypothetical protein PSTG_14417 [Puccinia striiformis f. sp. tritici PST-78]|uniref:Wax synthase domain-containing protein n=1 Tax=Puccinia striiformis f. sp. tritici PST-78 TaxID=1165861 RepID=A0A0L0UYP8_9BASI|nr:hypothetical protein PSTG_14417 [Puccinia striiformis f. sp. tritici PST-78]